MSHIKRIFHAFNRALFITGVLVAIHVYENLQNIVGITGTFRKRRKIFKYILINAYTRVSERRRLAGAKIQRHVSVKLLAIITPSRYGSKVDAICAKGICWIDVIDSLADGETGGYKNLIVAYSNLLNSSDLVT
ncbi:MAG: hypothetical protein RKO25_13075 [Candidatus Contendobacter sp.]|nr:hypothetical protein [Candidatus Contendobacter sp.]